MQKRIGALKTRLKGAVHLPAWAAWVLGGAVGLAATTATSWAWKVETTQDDHGRRISVGEARDEDHGRQLDRIEAKVDRLIDLQLARPFD